MTFDGVGSEQPVQGFVCGLGEGQPIDLPGWSMRVKVTAADTLGRFTVLHGQMAPQLAGPPAHVHAAHEEIFVVLAGRVRFRISDRFHTATPGERVYDSRRLAHGFANPHDEPVPYAAISTPQRLRGLLPQGRPARRRHSALPDPALTAELMAQHATVLTDPLTDPGT